MSALSPSQQRVFDAIVRIGRQRGETPMEIKAAVETGLVESNLTNVQGGDADSSGWRQERASIYKDPNNLGASINRFFDETSAVQDKYTNAGDLAAAVQRPAEQFRGRYAQRASEADTLLRGAHEIAGMPDPAAAQASSPTIETTPGSVSTSIDEAALEAARKRSVVGGYLQRHNPDSLLLRTGVLSPAPPNVADFTSTQVTPGQTTITQTQPAPGQAPAAAGGGAAGARGMGGIGGPLLELFWQGKNGIDVKRNQVQPQGFVSGHQDHVHVAAGPKTVVELGKLAQQMGLHVGENPHFGGVAPVHSPHSYHYRGEAIDVSGDPRKMNAYARRVEQLYGVGGR